MARRKVQRWGAASSPAGSMVLHRFETIELLVSVGPVGPRPQIIPLQHILSAKLEEVQGEEEQMEDVVLNKKALK